jgi:hypothetical protein
MDNTRPPALEIEAKRIAKEMLESVHDDVQWRIKMSESVARIETSQRFSESWQDAHDQLDRERFARIEGQYVVISGVASDGAGVKKQLEGANNFIRFIGGLVVVIAAIGGAVIWVMSLGKHP